MRQTYGRGGDLVEVKFDGGGSTDVVSARRGKKQEIIKGEEGLKRRGGHDLKTPTPLNLKHGLSWQWGRTEMKEKKWAWGVSRVRLFGKNRPNIRGCNAYFWKKHRKRDNIRTSESRWLKHGTFASTRPKKQFIGRGGGRT